MSDRPNIEFNTPIIRGIIALGFLLSALWLLGQSGYDFLRMGIWDSYSLLDAAVSLDSGDGKMVAFFREWVGLSKILDFISCWLALMVIFYLVLVAE